MAILTACLSFLVAFGTYVASQNTTRITTFNLEGSTAYPNKTTRLNAAIKALKSLDSDIYCLQEALFVNDVRKVISGMEQSHPYSYSILHENTRTVQSRLNKPPCNAIKFDNFMGCMLNNCSNITTQVERGQCAVSRCQMLSLKQECIVCMSSIGESSLCKTAAFQVNDPGLLIVSKRPLYNPAYSFFDPGVKQLKPQAVLVAEVDHLGFFLCTHLVADVGDAYSEHGLRNMNKFYENQNLKAIKILDAFYGIEPITIAGGINSSPAIPQNNVTPDFPDTYRIFLYDHFTSPYVQLTGLCTYCSDNTHTQTNNNFIFDHVFVRGLNVTSTKRVLTERIPGINIHMSDHYGIEVTVEH